MPNFVARCKRRRPCVGGRPKSSAAASTTRLAAGKQKPRASVPSSKSISANEILGLRHNLAKTFDLAFGLEVNCDPGSAFAPGRETGKELLPFRLRDDELAGVEFADLAIDKGTAEIFDRSVGVQRACVIPNGAQSNRGIRWSYLSSVIAG